MSQAFAKMDLIFGLFYSFTHILGKEDHHFKGYICSN